MTTPARTTPPMDAAERSTLEVRLDFCRATLVGRCDGSSGDRLRIASAPPIHDVDADPGGHDGGFDAAESGSSSTALRGSE